MERNYIIGIDLGSENSSVAVCQDGTVRVIQVDGEDRMPNWVSFTECGPLVGALAKEALWSNPAKTIDGVTTLLGRKFNDPVVSKMKSVAPFSILEGAKGKAMIGMINPRRLELLSPEEIGALLFAKLKAAAEEDLKHQVTQAVVSCPSNLGDDQRNAIISAAKMAGLNVRQMLNARNAAAMGYVNHCVNHWGNGPSTGLFLVYDWGKSWEASLLTVDGEDFEVHATVTDDGIGGNIFDSSLVDFCVEHIKKLDGVDLTSANSPYRFLSAACEAAKRSLSTEPNTEICLDFYGLKSIYITRLLFEELNKENFEKSVKPIEDLLKRSGEDKSDVTHVVLLGGSAQIPKLKDSIKDYFGYRSTYDLLDRNHILAEGAALQGEIVHNLSGAPFTLFPIWDYCNHNWQRIINRNTKLPTTITVERFRLCNARSIDGGLFEGDSIDDSNKLGDWSIGNLRTDGYARKAEITLTIDNVGNLEVTVREKTSQSNLGTFAAQRERIQCVTPPLSSETKLLSLPNSLQTLVHRKARDVVIAYCSVVEEIIERNREKGLIETKDLGNDVKRIRQLISQIALANDAADYCRFHNDLDRLCRPLLETFGKYESLLTLRPNLVPQAQNWTESGEICEGDPEVKLRDQIIQLLADEIQCNHGGSASGVAAL